LLFENMARITALIAQKRNKNRVNVYLDGAFAFGLAALEAARLRLGQELDPDDLERLKARDALAVAHERALRYLSIRPRSTAELRRYLAGKQVAPADAEEIITRLTRTGLLDDAAFARYWREQRDHARPRGAQALRQELRQKGVAREAIEGALAGLDEPAAALSLARARARRLAGLDQLTFKRRLAGFLGRRGYGFDIIRPIVERLWREAGDAAADPAAPHTDHEDE
jgi:regulatory protein